MGICYQVAIADVYAFAIIDLWSCCDKKYCVGLLLKAYNCSKEPLAINIYFKFFLLPF